MGLADRHGPVRARRRRRRARHRRPTCFAMPEFAPQMAAMIGLGVGIDYALFIVSRYRENLHAGMEPEEAVVHAVDTSGRAVMFAGITVIISLLGLFIIGLAFVARPRGRQRAQRAGDDDRGASRCCRRCSASPAGASTRHRVRPRSPSECSSLLAMVGVFTGIAARCRALGHRLRDRRTGRGRQLPAVRSMPCASTCRTARRSPASSSSGIAGAASSSGARGLRCFGVAILRPARRCRCSRSDSASATPANLKEDQTARRRTT